MYLLGLSLIFLALKLFGVSPVADLSWWWMLAPFALTALWWHWSDSSGRTRRRALEQLEQRNSERLSRRKQALGPGPRNPH